MALVRAFLGHAGHPKTLYLLFFYAIFSALEIADNLPCRIL